MSYLYLRPDENVLAGRTVTSITGTPDPDHKGALSPANDVQWLVDQRPAFPIRYPAGAWKVSISVNTQAIRLVALANHSLDANVTVGGDVVGTIVVPAAPPNGARLNPYLLLAASVPAVTTLTLEGTNAGAAIIGEAFAGVPRTLKAFKMDDMHDEFFDGGREFGGDYLNVPAYDEAREWRVVGGTTVFTTAEKDDVVAWFRAQRGYSLPSLLILDEAVNDARVVLLGRPSFRQFQHKDFWEATLMFVEYPRYRW